MPAGICMAGAVLTKETFLLFAPALLVGVWLQAPRETRRFVIGVFCAIFVMAASFYPLFAVLRGELLPGPHHTSLVDGIRFQLTRQGTGSIFDPHSSSRALVEYWLDIDAVVLFLGVLLIPLGLAVRRLRPVTVALVLPVAMLLRPGGYVPAMYVIGVLPFAALLPAASADWLYGLGKRAIGPGALTRFGPLRRVLAT